MVAIDEMRALIGRGLVTYGMSAQRKNLGARVATFGDSKGRITPYLVAGTPTLGTIVWLHGFSDRIDTFLGTARALLDRYEVIVPSMPAFGDGWIDANETYTIDAYGRWLTELLEQVAP